MQNHALTIYASPNRDALLEGEDRGGAQSALPGPGDKPVTERPDERAYNAPLAALAAERHSSRRPLDRA
jgi:hypothetical protein